MIFQLLDLKSGKVKKYDSGIYQSEDTNFHIVKPFLHRLLNKHININISSNIEIAESMPKQPNGFDCGVYLLLASDIITRGGNPVFSSKDVAEFRPYIKTALTTYATS